MKSCHAEAIMKNEKVYEVKFSESLDLDVGGVLADFVFPWREEEPPATEFSAVSNSETLAFRFRVEDGDLVLPDAEDPGEGALRSDRVELFFSPTADLLPFYYGAEMDPLGRVYDYRASFHRKFDPAWSFRSLGFSGEIREGGYQVEGTLALEELRDLGCLRSGEMIAGVYRAEFSHLGESIDERWISWVSPDSAIPDFHVPSSFGRFRFLPK